MALFKCDWGGDVIENLWAIIIDDDLIDTGYLRTLLATYGIEEARIWPANGDSSVKISEWNQAARHITALIERGWNPRATCCLLFLDVSLGPNKDTIQEGVRKITALLMGAGREYVSVIVTKHNEVALADLREVSDNIISKQRLLGDAGKPISDAEFAIEIEEAVASWSERTQRQAGGLQVSPVTVEDSPGARRLQTATRKNVASELAQRYTKEWSNTRATVLGGGFSGAFLLRLEGIYGGSIVGLVFKIARERDALERELAACEQMMARLTHFTNLLPLIDSKLHSLGSEWSYIRLGRVDGRTLEIASRTPVTGSSGSNGQSVGWLEPLEKLASSFAPAELPRRSLLEKLAITQDDVLRFDSSFEQLIDLRNGLVSRNFIANDDWHKPDALRDFRSDVVRKWPEACRRAAINLVPYQFQHGDLTLRNIIINKGNAPILIDFARSGEWPVMYDFARFHLQLYLRCVSIEFSRDSFPDDFRDWLKMPPLSQVIGTKLQRAESGSERSIFPAGDVGNELLSFWEDAATRVADRVGDVMDIEELRKLIAIMQCFDAIKICSYEDSTAFKRLWFLMIAVTCAKLAGLN